MFGRKKESFDSWGCGEDYKLVKKLGRGSYGEVAEAISSRNNNARCAIKQMERIFDEKTDAKRAYREIHILRHLHHRNIVGLFDVILTTVQTAAEGRELLAADETSRAVAAEQNDGGSKDIWGNLRGSAYSSPLDRIRTGNLYLVFEFMDTDLQKIMRSSQFMSEEHVKFILYQILAGLKYLHSANVIHRDLKPANILISCTDCTIKIADFGLSRVVNSDVANYLPDAERASMEGRDSGSKDSGGPKAKNEVDEGMEVAETLEVLTNLYFNAYLNAHFNAYLCLYPYLSMFISIFIHIIFVAFVYLYSCCAVLYYCDFDF